MRLIDLDEAIKLLRGKCVAKYPTTFSLGLFAAADELSKLPEADAVPVVRCKDCNHYNGHRHCTYFEQTVLDNDFCSYGERRSDDG